MTAELAITSFLIGLLGAGHCIGMCGGISAALAFALPADAPWQKRFGYILTYNVGRILSYLVIGVLAGLLGAQLKSLDTVFGFPFLRSLAGLMLVLMGLYVSGWWKVLARLERLGAALWGKLQPISAKLLPVRTLGQAFSLGALWGWLPCGLVYSTVFLALSQADLLASSLVMVAFGLGTMPALIVGGLAGERLKAALQSFRVRAFMGALLILFGLWTVMIAHKHYHHGLHVSSDDAALGEDLHHHHSD